MTASTSRHPGSKRVGKSRLVYAEDTRPGLTRSRKGKGWAYYDAKGQRVTDRDEILIFDRMTGALRQTVVVE